MCLQNITCNNVHFLRQVLTCQFSTSLATKGAKFYGSAEEAVTDIPDGAKLLVGGIRCTGRCIKPPARNRRLPSCIPPLFQSEFKCEAFHMDMSFIHMYILVHLHGNKTDFHMKGFTQGPALKQRQKATQKSPITCMFD